MQTVLHLVFHDFVCVYLDEIIITFRTFLEHLQYLATVFEFLHQVGLTLKLEKCASMQH